MLTRLYVEALLADPELADQVYELWNARAITDEYAAWAWWLVRSLAERIDECLLLPKAAAQE